MKKATIILFSVAVIVVLVTDIISAPNAYYIAKPMIMISLIGFYLASAVPENRSKTVILAMVFSLAGDVLLMWEGYFIPGLVSFLIAHVFYIMAYRQHIHQESENALLGVQKIRMAFPVVLAGTGLVVVLYPTLNEMKFPVMVYALVITVMVLQSLFRFGRTASQSFWLVFIGAVLFMISDATIAINKFMTPIHHAGIWIMSTYSVAQLLIVTGLVKHR